MSAGYNKQKNIIKIYKKKGNYLLFLLFLGLIYVVVNFFNLIKQEVNLYTYKNILINQFNTVYSEHQKLNNNISYIKSNFGIEELARKNLGYIKTNEIPIKIILK